MTLTRFQFSRRSTALLYAITLAGCASTGATFKSGVGDTFLEHPPYYGGRAMSTVARDSSAIGYLPVAFQRGASQPAIFDPRTGAGTPMDRLLDEMNSYLDSLSPGTRLVTASGSAKGAPAKAAVPPDVRFGCLTENMVPDEDCADRGGGVLGRSPQQMMLSVGRPSPEWITWNAALASSANTHRTLVITVEVGQYQMRQEGLLGKKFVELGTNHRVSLPWLTSLETPVSVLQLTASLVDRGGKAIRIGAEGFYPRRTGLLISALGGQELLSDEDVSAVRSARRDDLPGSPLAWQVAMRELVSRVTGR